MGKLTENLFGPREAAGHKDRCVRSDSRKYAERQNALPTVPTNRAGGMKQVGFAPPPTLTARSKEVIEKALLENRPTQRCFLVSLIALLRERKVGTPDRPLLEENKGCLCS